MSEHMLDYDIPKCGDILNRLNDLRHEIDENRLKWVELEGKGCVFDTIQNIQALYVVIETELCELIDITYDFLHKAIDRMEEEDLGIVNEFANQTMQGEG